MAVGVEHLDEKTTVWEKMEPGFVCIVTTLNEDSMFSIFATVCGSHLMIYPGFVGYPLPDPMDKQSQALLLSGEEIKDNFYTKGKFRMIECCLP